MPSRDIPGLGANPWATSCEFMYWKLEVDVQEDVEVVSKADPNSDMETSSAQCTLVIGPAVVVVGVVVGVVLVVGVNVERD